MTNQNQALGLSLAALAVAVLSGCSGMGSLMGQAQPALSPAAKAAAEMPLEKEPVVNTQDTYLALVRQMQAKSLWYASIAHLDALDRQWGASAESRLLRADALRQVGQPDAAATLYQSLLGGAHDGVARYGLGRVAAEQGDFGLAAQQMELARRSNPVNPRLLTDLGYAYLRAHDLNAARIPLMQAAQLSPEDAQVNVNLSLFMMLSGQTPQAEEFMRQRKLDAQTQQAVREQAGAWQQDAARASKAEPLPTGQVVNLSAAGRAMLAEPASTTSAAVPGAKIAEPALPKKTAPEPDPAAMRPLPAPREPSSAPEAAARSLVSNQWLVSGGGFDASRPRHPGAVAQPAYAVSVPVQSVAAVQAATAAIAAAALPATWPSAPPAKMEPAQSAIKNAVPLTEERQAPPAVRVPPAPVVATAVVLAVPEAARVPAEPVPTDSQAAVRIEEKAQAQPQPEPDRQPAAPASASNPAAVLMAAAGPVAVRQVSVAGSGQAVQTMVPRRATGGLFFETPDAETASAQKAPARERVWP
ncbi:hypothetical protein [Comamonas guangdongensis]|uniref:Tetratricopeptide repeat protein n=1 Tax=Comamonas guangdongensis TaxID=510515 RepID=A0ABV3ZXI8_9BURK